MIDFVGICGNKVSVNPNSIEYIQESVMMERLCTLLCFKSGKKIFVKEMYKEVRNSIEEAAKR